MKVKGISFTSQVAKNLTPSLLHSMVTSSLEPWTMLHASPVILHSLCQVKDPSSVKYMPQFNIRANMVQGRLFNWHSNKTLRFTSEKRWIVPGHNPTLDTLPFGYCDPATSP
jgi:hypothetical protein